MRSSSISAPCWSRRFLIGSTALAAFGAVKDKGDSSAVATGTRSIDSKTAGELAFTHGRADGNRIVGGQGTFPTVRPLDLPLGGLPRWVVVATEDRQTAVWVAVLTDGEIRAFRTTVDGAEEIAVEAEGAVRPPEMPPLVRVRGGRVTIVAAPVGSQPSPLTHPLPLDDGLAFIDTHGTLQILPMADRDQPPTQFPLAAPPDARIVTDGEGRVAVLTGRTADRYGHGVLGDAVEASGFAVVDVAPPRLLSHVELPPPDVIEGQSPLWADLDDNGDPEIVVTLSSSDDGGRLAVYNQHGDRLAVGPGFGRGGRWRHQLAVAAFGPTGETELAAVRTPHIGGVVEFWRLMGTQLSAVAELSGFTSHVLGSYNLDMVIGGDFDGDGRPEIVLPTQDRTRLAAIRRTEHGSGAAVAWDLPLDGDLATNLAAVELVHGIALGAGRMDGGLRIWLPA